MGAVDEQNCWNRLQRSYEREESGCLHVRKGHFEGRIFLQDGRVLHAQLYDLKGEDALFELASWGGCILDFRNGEVPEEFTINEPVDYLKAVYQDRLTDGSLKGGFTVEDLQELEAMQRHQEEDAKKLTKADIEPEAFQTPDIARMVIVLKTISNDWETRSYELDGLSRSCWTLGSDPAADICITHPSIDLWHCTFLLEDHVSIWDFGTENKTLLNSQVVEEALLSPGDQLVLGELVFEVNLRLRRRLEVETAKVTIPFVLKKPVTTGLINVPVVLNKKSKGSPEESFDRSASGLRKITAPIGAEFVRPANSSIFDRMLAKVGLQTKTA